MGERKVAIVTGGTRGIGAVIADEFLQAGYDVAICSRSAAALEKGRQHFGRWGDRVLVTRADVGNSGDAENLVRETSSRLGRLDVLVNNAGVYGPVGNIADLDVQEWIDALSANLASVFLMCRHAVPVMLAGGFGRIINLSGGGATAPMPGYSLYSASKAAVVRFTETTALELKNTPITVNAIAPGFIATQIHEVTMRAGQAAVGSFFEKTKKRLAEGGDDPRRAAMLAVKLAAPECKMTGRLISAIFDPWETFVTGQNLPEDLYTLRRIDDVFFKKVVT